MGKGGRTSPWLGSHQCASVHRPVVTLDVVYQFAGLPLQDHAARFAIPYDPRYKSPILLHALISLNHLSL